MQTVSGQILKRIQSRGKGSVFSAKDFVDLGSRVAIDQTLSRLAKSAKIRRLKHGLYDYPKIHPRLGKLSPTPDQVARAAARKTNSRLLPTGAQAANALGLSNQVPAQSVFLTDGPSRVLQLGHQTVQMKHAALRHFVFDGAGALVIQAMRFLGKDSIDGSVIRKLRTTLSTDDKVRLLKELHNVPGWMLPFVKQITRSA